MAISGRMALAFIVAATTAMAGYSAENPPSSEAHWFRIRNADLVVYSNAPEADAISVAQNLGVFQQVLSRFGVVHDAASPVPTSIFLFRSDADYDPYKPRRRTSSGSVTTEVSGFFVKHRDGNYITASVSPLHDPWSVIYHEYFHFFLHNNFTDIPPWLDEGLAEYYSTFRFKDGAARIGAPVYPHLETMKEHGLMPLPSLIAIDRSSPEYQEGTRRGIFYAESWALVHYLLWGGGRQAGGFEFLAGLPSGASLADAVKPLLGSELLGLTDQLKGYVKNYRPWVRSVEIGAVAGAEALQPEPLRRDEISYRLGDYLFHLDPERSEETERLFREAIAVNPENALAYAGMGQVLASRNQAEESDRNFEKSLALDPGSPEIQLRYAFCLLDREYAGGLERRVPGEVSPPLKKARELFQKGLAKAPEMGEAWEGLGMTYLFDSGDVSQGILALKNARQILPGEEEIAVDLAQLYARTGNREKARELVDRVVSRSSQPELRAAGAELLFRADLAAVDKLFLNGELEKGLELLKELEAKAPTVALKSEIRSLRSAAEKNASQNSLIAKYNLAVEKVNAKDYAGAEALLQQVLSAGSDPDLLERARTGLSRTREAEEIDWYNQAVARLNKHDLPGAEALLRRVVQRSGNKQLVDTAKKLLGEIHIEPKK